MKLRLIEKIITILIVFFPINNYANEDHSDEHRQHEAHVHGAAKLSIAIDETTFFFELETPALNVLGFEHKPKTDQEKERVQEVNKLFSSHENIILIPHINCKQTHIEIEPPYESEDVHDKDGHDEEEHGEYHLSYTLSCEDISNIKDIEIKLFDNFDGFENIEVMWIHQEKADSSNLTKDNKIIKIK